jgi:oxygen-independent coproporphyrinogen-3 oxidase
MQTNFDKNVMAITDGFLMSEDERMRKMMILGINKLSRKTFNSLFDVDPVKKFFDEIKALSELDLVNIVGDYITLTRKGVKYRDIVVQVFLSQEVLKRINAYNYDD